MSTPPPRKKKIIVCREKMPRVFGMQCKAQDVTENVKDGLKWDGAIQDS